MPIDLCARVNFRAYRMVENGVAWLAWVSDHRTQVNNAGLCKRICAEMVLHPGLGVFGAMIRSNDKVCFGGFINLDGCLGTALRGELAGHLVCYKSTSMCDPVIGYGAYDCEYPPDMYSLCYDRPAPPGLSCIYCVDNSEQPQPVCTIEQDTTSYPCAAGGAPTGGGILGPGFLVTPAPEGFDLLGDAGPFYANDGMTGLWKYYLSDGVRLRVTPELVDPEQPTLCDQCFTWLCHVSLHYLAPLLGWSIQCTEVLPIETPDDTGACCEYADRDHDIFLECHQDPPGSCTSQYEVFRGSGSQCDLLDCETEVNVETGACCLPTGQCAEVTESECTLHGGVFSGLMSYCAAVNCPGPEDPNEAARVVDLTFQPAIGYAVFSAANDMCFHLADMHCMTAGPDSGACGVDPCWNHPTESDPVVPALDSLAIDCNMGVSTDDVTHPHVEPEYNAIANAALAEVANRVLALSGRSRMNSYDKTTLNLWSDYQEWHCVSGPVIWSVNVVPRGLDCAFPAELVLGSVYSRLRISVEPGSAGLPDPDAHPFYFGQYRVSAVFTCEVHLNIKLLDGWEHNPCPLTIANTPGNPCDPQFSDPAHYMMIQSSGCTMVPRVVHWRGLLGPAPYSRGNFEFRDAPSWSGHWCCPTLCMIDNTVIPAEVNALSAPGGAQKYTGDVVIMLNSDPCGCGT